jgi:hypothetical protein
MRKCHVKEMKGVREEWSNYIYSLIKRARRRVEAEGEIRLDREIESKATN